MQKISSSLRYSFAPLNLSQLPKHSLQDIVAGKLPCDPEVIENEIKKTLNRKKRKTSVQTNDSIETIISRAKAELAAERNQIGDDDDHGDDDGVGGDSVAVNEAITQAINTTTDGVTGVIVNNVAPTNSQSASSSMSNLDPLPPPHPHQRNTTNFVTLLPGSEVIVEGQSGIAKGVGSFADSPSLIPVVALDGSSTLVPSSLSIPSSSPSSLTIPPRHFILNSNKKFRIVEIT